MVAIIRFTVWLSTIDKCLRSARVCTIGVAAKRRYLPSMASTLASMFRGCCAKICISWIMEISSSVTLSCFSFECAERNCIRVFEFAFSINDKKAAQQNEIETAHKCRNRFSSSSERLSIDCVRSLDQRQVTQAHRKWPNKFNAWFSTLVFLESVAKSSRPFITI